jgi:predicted dehydrogenase
MKRIKIAQIGTGHDHAPAAINVLKRRTDLFELIGFAVVPEDDGNVSAMRYESTKQAYEGVPQLTVEEILNYPGLDAVCIETEDRALTKYALMAAQKGLHIHMDKPGGISNDEFDRLVDTVSEKNLVFHTGYMYRYNPAIQKLKEDIRSGKLGEILCVEAQMNCCHPLEKRNWLGNYPGGMLYFLGCHMVDLIYSIMGQPLDVIPMSCSSGAGGTAAKDFGMAVFQYPHGVSFAKSTAVERGGFERRQLVVVGTEGTVELRPLEWASGGHKDIYAAHVTGVHECYSDAWAAEGERYDSPVYGRYDNMFCAFARYVNAEEKNPFDYEYERSLHKLLLKACGEK